ncbi:MAG TPA: ATP-binding cassette domain-containing protein [Acidimicrobiales bacterium]|nr:ATP-binding cassette domain-containing protein [Acidimicrobiales bacterium]
MTRRAQPPAVTAAELVKTYPGGRGKPPIRALDGLSLGIEPGQVFGLLGPNGAGKSTTVKILSTLARPDSGRATVAGIDVAKDPDGVRRCIGLVGQKASSDPMATGTENLVLAGRIQGLSHRQATARAGELLAHFGLADAADRLAKTYSGGMARKLDVALGLVHRPVVLFLDEPTTGLDPEARAEMWAEIEGLSAGQEVAVLLTTHYLEEADRLADRVAIVDHGQIVAEGTPEQLKQELHGDTVDVEVAAADPATVARAGELLRRQPGTTGDVTVQGARLTARTADGARAVPGIVAALEEAGVELASITVARPSLDDVYLRHAGRRMEVAA